MAQKVRSCGIITLGAVIYALAFDWFVAPNQIAMGGVTGLAQIVNALVPVLPVGVLSILVNVPLFLAGWRFIGFHLLASSLFSMAVSSAAMDGIARQPEASGDIRMSMIIAAALVEGVALIAIVVCLLTLFL